MQLNDTTRADLQACGRNQKDLYGLGMSDLQTGVLLTFSSVIFDRQFKSFRIFPEMLIGEMALSIGQAVEREGDC